MVDLRIQEKNKCDLNESSESFLLSSQILFWSQLELCSRVWEKIYFPFSWPTSMGCPIFDWQLLNIFDFYFFQQFLWFTLIAIFITFFRFLHPFLWFTLPFQKFPSPLHTSLDVFSSAIWCSFYSRRLNFLRFVQPFL